MALAFANRSAVWNDRGEFALAIRDADLAFEANYPEELKHKLFERKGQCHAALGKTEEATKNLQKAIEMLEISSIKVVEFEFNMTEKTRILFQGERRKAKEKAIRKMIEDVDTFVTKPMGVADDLSTKFVRKLAPELRDPHPRFPSFSKAIKVSK